MVNIKVVERVIRHKANHLYDQFPSDPPTAGDDPDRYNSPLCNPPTDFAPSDVVWERVTGRGPYILVQRKEGLGAPLNIQVEQGIFQQEQGSCTWIARDRRGTLVYVEEPLLTHARPVSTAHALRLWMGRGLGRSLRATGSLCSYSMNAVHHAVRQYGATLLFSLLAIAVAVLMTLLAMAK